MRNHGRRLKRIDEPESDLASVGCGGCFLLLFFSKGILLGALVLALIYFLLTH